MWEEEIIRTRQITASELIQVEKPDGWPSARGRRALQVERVREKEREREEPTCHYSGYNNNRILIILVPIQKSHKERVQLSVIALKFARVLPYTRTCTGYNYIVHIQPSSLLPAAFLDSKWILVKAHPISWQKAVRVTINWPQMTKQYLWNTSMHVGAYTRTNLQNICYPSG